jgi:hypothetical protein
MVHILHNKDWPPPGDDFYEAEFPPPYAPAAATGWEIFMLLAGILLGLLIATGAHAEEPRQPTQVCPISEALRNLQSECDSRFAAITAVSNAVSSAAATRAVAGFPSGRHQDPAYRLLRFRLSPPFGAPIAVGSLLRVISEINGIRRCS